MNMKKLIVILTLGFLMQSCSTIKMEKDSTKASPKIVYSKGACFGKCPIFTLTIYNTGQVKFKGRKFTQRDGLHEKILDKSTYVKLVKAFKDNRFWRFDDTYGMDLVDASTTTISFSDDGKVKTVKGKSQFPEKLKRLMSMLNEIVSSDEGWMMIDKPIKADKVEEIIDNQIIIKTADGMIMSRWLQEYKKYGVRLMNRMGNENNLWLIRFDKKVISPDDMLQMVKDDKFISEAEFNKKITDR